MEKATPDTFDDCGYIKRHPEVSVTSLFTLASLLSKASAYPETCRCSDFSPEVQFSRASRLLHNTNYHCVVQFVCHRTIYFLVRKSWPGASVLLYCIDKWQAKQAFLQSNTTQ